MYNFCKVENDSFGVTKAEAVTRTKHMIREEAEQINGLTRMLKSYLTDLDAAFAVFECQESNYSIDDQP